ncbi:hypothetical protein Q8F55_000285 [Vanrija albida]|uniref:MARVEL domain-containing protein n=1 Tax=Vanrija albida TaxID=181172 RepID=A0ABR3QCU1_9TREE
MVTTNSPSPSPEPIEKREDGAPAAPDAAGAGISLDDLGFLGLLAKSIWEPGVNSALVIAMNISFFLLILCLTFTAYVSNWNKHVLFLLFTSFLLWMAMVWFVMEITRVQNNPENAPPADPLLAAPAADETRKDR